MGREATDDEINLVLYDIIVSHVKNNKQLILGFIYKSDRCVPILSKRIEDIRERWRDNTLHLLYEILILPQNRVIPLS
ncbi:MAG: hypothetical protein Solivirus1_3 [Solivirus sp.]|uniref:Uncharacterized protein n=1 Tax=Solivirus sp. TaxID=2487772 RepID=A0A3G5AF53_9VIRU|nr:MAG: hypothetical protein Solivirus1_3 [Solivirus sp.]